MGLDYYQLEFNAQVRLTIVSHQDLGKGPRHSDLPLGAHRK